MRNSISPQNNSNKEIACERDETDFSGKWKPTGWVYTVCQKHLLILPKRMVIHCKTASENFMYELQKVLTVNNR